jgi:hypothetical protein
MPTQSESPAAVRGTPSKTLLLLRKRLRQLLRVLLVVTIGLAVAATALAIWWLTSLKGLPDIGDPFDVAAFRTFRLPDDQNAFAFFRRAWKAVEPNIYYLPGSSETIPEFRAFVEANRPAVELIIKGAEQGDGISGPVGEPLPGENNSDLASAYPLQASRAWMIGIMLTEGSLREQRGDMAGAWDCYRAVLRMTVHVRRRERLNDRLRVTLWLPAVQKRLATWAADPRTTIGQVRRALEEVVACRPRPEWDAFTLKIEYLDLMRCLDRRVVPPPEQIEEEWTYRLGDMQLPIDLSRDLYQVKRGLAREPERSRRVIRLLFANWLAHVERPERRKPAARARFHIAKRTSDVLLYHVSPDAPAGARALSPQEVASWLVTTNDAKLAFRYGFMAWPNVRRREHRSHRELLVLLAGEIYRRERGARPPSDEALVGTYLESLPDDGSADLADEMTPTVE